MNATAHSVGGDLLEQAYRDLDLDHGRLLETSVQPVGDADAWESVGDWLMLAHRMDAERVFFVGDDPVILFSRLPAGARNAEILAAYRRAWSLARPQCLFLATQDELHVYALNAPPKRPGDDAEVMEPLVTIQRSADVAERLVLYHRESIESGILFGEGPYARQGDGRADAQLLHDVRAANEALVDAGLPPTVSHALIERVILVRYLEDRQIIGREYFEGIAAGNSAWLSALDSDDGVPQFGAQSTFASCLANRHLAYAVFEHLERDFNGDLFLVDADERDRVAQRHCDLIRDLLTGAGLDPQQPLFLWAYDFSVVPTSLISSMYEQFHRAVSTDDVGTYYTPPELVEFVLGRVLTPDVLDQRPKICDPACGSGIFLVEAFRRIARHARVAKGRDLRPDELRELLFDQIAGVDVNEAAIRLAAFSLHLAYLNYLDPNEIVSAGQLPRLIHRPDVAGSAPVLVAADAFSPTRDEQHDGDTPRLPWADDSFDVVVGNPPWSEPKSSDVRMGDEWARKRGFAVGDRNPSQQFLWRALTLLKPGGVAAMLVAATAFHNSRSTSRRFRSQWLRAAEMCEIVDFTSARALFFDSAVAPFMLIVFRPQSPERSTRYLAYSTVRPSRPLKATKAVAHAQLERRWVHQEALANRDYLWKTCAWGNHHHESFMSRLDMEQTLEEFLPLDPGPGWGYQRGEEEPSRLLRELPSVKRFDSWGPFRYSTFEPQPDGVKRQPDESRYEGQRIVIAQGIRSGFGPAARLETVPFSFRHTIYCLPLESVPPWQAKTVLGTLLSALGRYRLFMKSGKWGVWRDKLLAHDILDLPIRMPTQAASVTRRIERAIDRLRHLDHAEAKIAAGYEGPTESRRLNELLLDIDEAVFDLFETSPAERDLVRDFIDYTLPLVGRRNGWLNQPRMIAGEQRRGTANDLAVTSRSAHLDRYLSAFLQVWNPELAPNGEFSWFISAAPRAQMTAVVFETRERDVPIVDAPEADEQSWQSALERLGHALELPVTASIRAIGTLRSVSDRHIVIVKRNDARLWTASAAREDAEATILQAINLQSAS